jgi:mono/diheme cytochrome c family protein
MNRRCGRAMALGLVLLVSAVSGTRGHAAEPQGAQGLSPLQEHGKQAYYRACMPCHGPGLWGTNRLARRLDKDHALLESRTDLTPEIIRAAVRLGLGSMPPYRRTEVSDADVQAIAAYLTRGNR